MNNGGIFKRDFSTYLYVWISIQVIRGEEYELFYLISVHGNRLINSNVIKKELGIYFSKKATYITISTYLL